jgi:hypothetical protein
MESLLQKLALKYFLPKTRKTEKIIGYRLYFPVIPSRFINSYMQWDMTKQFQKFGLEIEAGADYWTMGRIVNGVSSRYDSESPEYQSWLGGYTVKLPSNHNWTPKQCSELAIVDQDDWLHMYGDPKPFTSTDGWDFKKVEDIKIGQHIGIVYEFGCTTHSDVGNGDKSFKLRFETPVIAAFLNYCNRALKLNSRMFIPKVINGNYELLKLKGYIAIFDIAENVKVVLYGNGTEETFPIIKDDLLKAIRACEIVKV